MPQEKTSWKDVLERMLKVLWDTAIPVAGTYLFFRTSLWVFLFFIIAPVVLNLEINKGPRRIYPEDLKQQVKMKKQVKKSHVMAKKPRK